MSVALNIVQEHSGIMAKINVIASSSPSPPSSSSPPPQPVPPSSSSFCNLEKLPQGFIVRTKDPIIRVITDRQGSLMSKERNLNFNEAEWLRGTKPNAQCKMTSLPQIQQNLQKDTWKSFVIPLNSSPSETATTNSELYPPSDSTPELRAWDLSLTKL